MWSKTVGVWKIRNGPMQMGNRRGRGIEVQRPGNTNEKRRDGMMRRKLKMAIIGGGLMGKEMVSGAKRWCHLKRDIPQPEIVGVATQTVQSLKWFQDNVEQLQWATTDYRELLEKEEIDAVYCAVPSPSAPADLHGYHRLGQTSLRGKTLWH